MSPRKRTTIIVAAVIAVLAVIVAAVLGMKVSADTRARNIDGLYSFTSDDNLNLNLSVGNGRFSATDLDDLDSGFSGSVDKGTISGDSVIYRLTGVTATDDGEPESITDLFGYDLGLPLDDGDDDSQLARNADIRLTVPRDVSRGNVVGTWELSVGLLNMKAAATVLTVNQDGSFTYSSQVAGRSVYDKHGRWKDLGIGRYALYDSDGDLITNVSMAH